METMDFQEFRKEFGRRLQRVRKTSGMTQKQLGDELDCSRNHIGYLERGAYNPSFALLYQLSCALGVEVRDFFADSGETADHSTFDASSSEAQTPDEAEAGLLEYYRTLDAESKVALRRFLASLAGGAQD